MLERLPDGPPDPTLLDTIAEDLRRRAALLGPGAVDTHLHNAVADVATALASLVRGPRLRLAENSTTTRPGRENAEGKGRRLLAEGRLDVLHVAHGRIEAVCGGDSGERYDVGYQRGGWSCSCPALGRCSHLTALMLVTSRPGDE